MAKITYLAQVNSAYYIDPLGAKREHTIGSSPTANGEISKIHSAYPEAVVVLTQSKNQAIQIATGSTMSAAAKQTLLAELDRWAKDLPSTIYRSTVADWAFAISDDNHVCMIQPPAGDKITDEQIKDMKQLIGQWIDNLVNAPAQPNPGTGTGTGGGAQAPAQQPNGQPNPDPGTGTGGSAQAPADPLEGFTPMQRAGFEKTMAMIEKICV